MNTKKKENRLAGFLFILVIIIFSFAEKDAKKLDQMYQNAQLKKDNVYSPVIPVVLHKKV